MKIARFLKSLVIVGSVMVVGSVDSANAQSADWGKIVEAAKKEGEVIVWASSGLERRMFWKDSFEKDNPGIKVNLFQPNSSSQRDQRYVTEFQSGLAKVDILMGGSADMNSKLKPAGVLQPLRPFLRADILDGKNWVDGSPYWVDEEKQYIIVSDLTPTPAITVNKSIADGVLQNWTDLLDPKYDGKIIMTDPRQAGQGFAMTVFFYNTPDLGPSFVERLFKGGRIVFSPDERQTVEWIDSGRVLIGIYARPQEVEALQKIGGGLRMIPALKAGGVPQAITVGSAGAIGIPNLKPLPNPNAAQVYMNWLLSKQGQQAMIDTNSILSTRTDVDLDKLPAYFRRVDGVKYTSANDPKMTSDEQVNAMRDTVTRSIGAK